MGIRSLLSKPIASFIIREQQKWTKIPDYYQLKTFKNLVDVGVSTLFGKDHGFEEIKSYEDFKNQVPIVDYEGILPYIEKILKGTRNVLWEGLPIYFATTSGTTSGVKYIPITKDSINNHINSARNALLSYVYETNKPNFLDGKLIFLSGSPALNKNRDIPQGRLSGIVNHHVPSYLKANRLPSYNTNCIEDWEEKIDKIADETINQPMSLISGIPPWVQMYFDKLVERRQMPVKDIFPDFSIFVYGGVNFEPYKAKLYDTIGKKIDSIETYPSSEGFIAYQDTQTEEGLLLLLNSGIFFEFIPLEEIFKDNPTRLMISEVEIGKNYAVVINSNAGLWGYSLGDTIKFVSKSPYRIIVSGRIKHFISAFGEHVIGEEVEKAMSLTCLQLPETELVEFTVAPNVTPDDGLPRHEWYIEFANDPNSMETFTSTLDLNLRKINVYYDDLIAGSVLTKLNVIKLKKNTFIDYMRSIGKLGGQNKIPRLSNDRKIAEKLQSFAL